MVGLLPEYELPADREALSDGMAGSQADVKPADFGFFASLPWIFRIM